MILALLTGVAAGLFNYAVLSALLPRDTDGTRQGGDAKAAPGPKPCQAGAEGIAQTHPNE